MPGGSGGGGGGGGGARPVLQPPIFVFPSELNFYVPDVSRHKQTLSIYNPYDVTVKYRILCNKPSKYFVDPCEGTIQSETCSDVIIKHVLVSPANTQEKDKFRIHLFDNADELLSKKDILATLHAGFPPPDDEFSHSLPHRIARRDYPQEAPHPPQGIDSAGLDEGSLARLQPQPQPTLVACLTAIVCIFALCLPTEGEGRGEDSFFRDYPWLHLTATQKLVFAYVLGLVTMNILRTT